MEAGRRHSNYALCVIIGLYLEGIAKVFSHPIIFFFFLNNLPGKVSQSLYHVPVFYRFQSAKISSVIYKVISVAVGLI